MKSSNRKPKWCGSFSISIRGKTRASTRSLECSTNTTSRHGQEQHDGNDPQYGACCAILLIEDGPASAKLRLVPGNGLLDPCDSVMGLQIEIARTTNGHGKTGSRSRSRLWSAKKRLHWPKSNWKRINAILHVAPSNQRCCRECSSASGVDMRSTGHQRGPHGKKSTITAAWVRMHTGI